MTHTAHPDIATHGLADRCDQCRDYALSPWSLDERCLRGLIRRTMANRFGGYDQGPTWSGDTVPARSENEALAMATVMTLFERVGRVCEVDSDSLLAYLSERWNLQLA